MEVIDYYIELQRVIGFRVTLICAVILLVAVAVKMPGYIKSYKNRKLPR